jgi:hypothetical protein
MTEGIRIAIIGAAGLVLAALVPLLFRKKAVKNPMQKIAVEELRPNSPQASQNLPERDTPVHRRTTDLSHKQISDVIAAVPPLQQDGISASFKGVYVSWRGKLFSASRRLDKTWVTLDNTYELGGVVICTAAHHDCVALLVAPKGTDLIVHGRIKDVHIHEACLEGCKFEIPRKAVA